MWRSYRSDFPDGGKFMLALRGAQELAEQISQGKASGPREQPVPRQDLFRKWK